MASEELTQKASVDKHTRHKLTRDSVTPWWSHRTSNTRSECERFEKTVDKFQIGLVLQSEVRIPNPWLVFQMWTLRSKRQNQPNTLLDLVPGLLHPAGLLCVCPCPSSQTEGPGQHQTQTNAADLLTGQAQDVRSREGWWESGLCPREELREAGWIQPQQLNHRTDWASGKSSFGH